MKNPTVEMPAGIVLDETPSHVAVGIPTITPVEEPQRTALLGALGKATDATGAPQKCAESDFEKLCLLMEVAPNSRDPKLVQQDAQGNIYFRFPLAGHAQPLKTVMRQLNCTAEKLDSIGVHIDGSDVFIPASATAHLAEHISERRNYATEAQRSAWKFPLLKDEPAAEVTPEIKGRAVSTKEERTLLDHVSKGAKIRHPDDQQAWGEAVRKRMDDIQSGRTL